MQIYIKKLINKSSTRNNHNHFILTQSPHEKSPLAKQHLQKFYINLKKYIYGNTSLCTNVSLRKKSRSWLKPELFYYVYV